MYQFEQLQWDLQQFCGQSFQPVESRDDLETGQLIIVDIGSNGEGVRFRRAIVTRIMTRYGSAAIVFI